MNVMKVVVRVSGFGRNLLGTQRSRRKNAANFDFEKYLLHING
jgi:hypothetical protein